MITTKELPRGSCHEKSKITSLSVSLDEHEQTIRRAHCLSEVRTIIVRTSELSASDVFTDAKWESSEERPAQGSAFS